MPLVRLDTLHVREIFPGLRARVVHTERTSQSWVDIDAGASFPEHQHPHEQVVNVLEGKLELVVNGEAHTLSAGAVFVIPPTCRMLDEPSSAVAFSMCSRQCGKITAEPVQ